MGGCCCGEQQLGVCSGAGRLTFVRGAPLQVDAAIEAISNRKKTLEGSIFGEANKADDRLVIARIMEEALGE